MLNAVFVDISGFALFGLLFLCYRPHHVALYAGKGGYARSIDGDYTYELEGARAAKAPAERFGSVEPQALRQ